MECDQISKNVHSALPINVEDARMDVDTDLSEVANAIAKEESVLMDVCGTAVVDVVKNKHNECLNGKDEVDHFTKKSCSIQSETVKTSPQVHSVGTKTKDIIDKTNLNKTEVDTTGDTKEELELDFSEEFLIPEYISDKEFATSEEMLSCCPWELGQLAWARMSIYPFWPCIVTYEPSPLQTYRKIQSKGRSKTLMIHVHFFNDHGRHSWIPSHHMIPFNGIEDFRKRARSVTENIRKKEPKFAAAMVIKPTIFPTWQKAVAEAMDVLYDLDLSALENFKKKGKKTPISSDEPEPKRKRKSKGDDDGP
ncbi:histone-lysine N-methyltransferase NSD3 isoform X2 [Copidosoma floridanum]|uniref:histone-lysine N-methyltransferase NSD3 isoform X2 n=1 Tax=Copidosoma floridanum TaxID=29053 RepID=UPI0006C9A62C|nr:histone-lysine N-methyltransferase NSD3 isoform X2 [Copidosoma floridanum]